MPVETLGLDIGNGQLLGQRETQQDYFASFSVDEYSVLLLADGIGGLEHGELASQVAVKAMKDYLSTRDISDPVAALRAALEHANHVVAGIVEDQHSSQGMGTTLVALMIGSEQVHWLSVGDSLLYRGRSQSLAPMNTPHTRLVQLQEQVQSGVITQSDADNDPQRLSITSAVTGDAIAKVDCKSEARWADDVFLLASDGLNEVHHSILQSHVFKGQEAQSIVNGILDEVTQLNDEAQDNCTVLLARPALASAAQANRQGNRWMLVTAIGLLLLCIPAGYWYLFHPSGPAQKVVVENELVNDEPAQLSLENEDGAVAEETVSQSADDTPGDSGDSDDQSPSATDTAEQDQGDPLAESEPVDDTPVVSEEQTEQNPDQTSTPAQSSQNGTQQGDERNATPVPQEGRPTLSKDL